MEKFKNLKFLVEFYNGINLIRCYNSNDSKWLKEFKLRLNSLIIEETKKIKFEAKKN